VSNYQINLDARIKKCFDAINANIVICEYDSVQLFFL